ncbi:hypothetical protein SAMN05443572_113199 [Myxococcus fulvus]|uniref:Uncharacterized protein n=1 Tax=Myxococcus fulvus TaxID=33 RepID=A0A511TCJ9_MYXFU|nr:hypothetical protein [Myxococcus fulvus]GEN11909.1 hypothetical protein MFU01_69460 [Myxococcus fulvus]SEU38795.1 hypothetical protein SAMN05443572_113199 [Myxococcus fulvus]
MIEAARITAFEKALRTAFTQFKAEEEVIRAKHAAAVQSGSLRVPLDDDALLERPTRRFLIDPMLRALDWNPDDPNQLQEEARSWAENGDRLYFDYLGVSRQRAPTLLVEAKGADSVSARPPREDNISAPRMSELLSEALVKLKTGDKPGVLAQWVAWLKDLRTYVASFSEADRSTLKRVVITAGRWLIIFRNPLTAFINDSCPDSTEIHCYVSPAEILERHREIYSLLDRRRLIDTLPLTMTLGEALQVLKPEAVTQAYRGMVVATRMTGGRRSEFPHRVVYPALVLLSGGRAFAVVDYNPNPAFEPREASQLRAFIAELTAKADHFQERVLNALNRIDLRMAPASDFPINIREPELGGAFAPELGSTVALAPTAPNRPQLVRQTGERNAQYEFLVITGQSWFYKEAPLTGPECAFHNFPIAKKRGVAGVQGRFEYVADSFTTSDDPQNCEHADLLGVRRSRCQMLQIESHLCCRACIFHGVCWDAAELGRLPCGK